jgi:hypothetical protein
MRQTHRRRLSPPVRSGEAEPTLPHLGMHGSEDAAPPPAVGVAVAYRRRGPLIGRAPRWRWARRSTPPRRCWAQARSRVRSVPARFNRVVQDAQALDLALHPVAGLQEAWRILGHAHSGRGAGGDHVAG